MLFTKITFPVTFRLRSPTYCVACKRPELCKHVRIISYKSVHRTSSYRKYRDEPLCILLAGNYPDLCTLLVMRNNIL